jgi:hypothetical protein
MSWDESRRRGASARRARPVLWLGVLGCMLGAPWSMASTRAQEVFVARGEHGEMSFSDEERPGARKVTVTVPEPASGAIEEAERRIEQTLRVARALEQSRLAREEARARARAPAAAGTSGGYQGYQRNDYLAQHVIRPAYPYLPPHRHPPHPPGDVTEPPAQEPATLSAPLLRRGATRHVRPSWQPRSEG